MTMDVQAAPKPEPMPAPEPGLISAGLKLIPKIGKVLGKTGILGEAVDFVREKLAEIGPGSGAGMGSGLGAACTSMVMAATKATKRNSLKKSEISPGSGAGMGSGLGAACTSMVMAATKATKRNSLKKCIFNEELWILIHNSSLKMHFFKLFLFVALVAAMTMDVQAAPKPEPMPAPEPGLISAGIRLIMHFFKLFLFVALVAAMTMDVQAAPKPEPMPAPEPGLISAGIRLIVTEISPGSGAGMGSGLGAACTSMVMAATKATKRNSLKKCIFNEELWILTDIRVGFAKDVPKCCCIEWILWIEKAKTQKAAKYESDLLTNAEISPGSGAGMGSGLGAACTSMVMAATKAMKRNSLKKCIFHEELWILIHNSSLKMHFFKLFLFVALVAAMTMDVQAAPKPEPMPAPEPGLISAGIRLIVTEISPGSGAGMGSGLGAACTSMVMAATKATKRNSLKKCMFNEELWILIHNSSLNMHFFKLFLFVALVAAMTMDVQAAPKPEPMPAPEPGLISAGIRLIVSYICRHRRGTAPLSRLIVMHTTIGTYNSFVRCMFN
ncbi:unnamed protein product [Chrysodeixis includens]|uniref:Uncharacterized protein n=1 Tax=Chrysodeixis includens TaxID=689277 RepID=A0A9N8KVY3_CHRIL|nr:unnamed protein product [Chrysodeixis includens]